MSGLKKAVSCFWIAVLSLCFCIADSAYARGKRIPPSAGKDTVVYNTKSGKIHSPGCKWAHRCTANCITTDRQSAYRMGGVPCKVCGAR